MASGTFRIEKPEAINMTLTITMSVAEWNTIRSKLDRARDPEWYMAYLITRAMEKANETFHFYDQIEEGDTK